MTEPCKDCNKEESLVYREGKVLLRFIRANKKPRGAMQNYKDGQTYWMFPRHAAFPWWEPAEKVDFPIVKPATKKDSVLEPSNLDDIESPAYLGESGISIKPGVGPTGGFIEPIAENIRKIEEEKSAGFTVASPSDSWTKKELLDFIKSKGGVGKMEMRKNWLLEIALNLA